MPRLSDKTRADRRQHILTSAWGCFSRNGFHATSMDDVIAATGMSSSAVYRYFRSKDDLIDASADEALALVRDIFVRLLDEQPAPSPGQTLAIIVSELHGRTQHPDYDLTRLALQTWAEAVRRPLLAARTRALYHDTRELLATLTARWKTDGHLPADADSDAAAAVVFALMHGLLVCHHLGADVALSELTRGIGALGAGLGGN
ncbi:TetR/AcrR family transcriptional regulator [Amycolatopsis sp. H20-H5]|uniref:TetR/AcrR family transcriptional regulator n=1 Tax=Amycolatopsis sp. H20-H5 TaxID=3046309 RepID=UPI002DB8FFD6|nr:TetR/AcrR family transcriptional regulator [Amycolatopsis sp. H20-H5]MEC3976959.1 TetR/AcrR family transcriptional regulator [Amycolatopsis sp. H20-H5]